MSDGTRSKPVVVVMGTTAEEPPPGIDTIAGDVELRYAPDRASLEREIADAEIVYTWWGEREDLEAVWPRANNVKWVAASNVGINRLLFPALVESDVPLTNARGAADVPIAETVVGFVVAMAKGFRSMFDRQRAHSWELHRMERLAGRRALIVGPGPIGRAIGRALRDGLGDAGRGGGARRTCRRRPVRDRPRRRRVPCRARGCRLRDRHDAVDAADAPHVRRGGLRRHEADGAVRERRTRSDGGADGARRRVGIRRDRRCGARRLRGGAATRPTVRSGRWRTSSSVRICRATWKAGRRTSRTCSTTTFAGTCAVRRCATSSTSGSASRRTIRACRSTRALLGWAT